LGEKKIKRNRHLSEKNRKKNQNGAGERNNNLVYDQSLFLLHGLLELFHLKLYAAAVC
jgi:hypothetical protein